MSFQVTEKSSVIACRTSWCNVNTKVPEELISNKRAKMDSKLMELAGMNFFFSCVTGTTSNASANYNQVRPGVAYFICYQESLSNNKETIFALLHDARLDASVISIRTRRTSGNDANAVLLAIQQVVKVSESSKLCILHTT